MLTSIQIDKIVNNVINEINKKSDMFSINNNMFCFAPLLDNIDETYDTIIKRQNGLPHEYFEPTDIEYAHNEFCINS